MKTVNAVYIEDCRSWKGDLRPDQDIIHYDTSTHILTLSTIGEGIFPPEEKYVHQYKGMTANQIVKSLIEISGVSAKVIHENGFTNQNPGIRTYLLYHPR